MIVPGVVILAEVFTAVIFVGAVVEYLVVPPAPAALLSLPVILAVESNETGVIFVLDGGFCSTLS